MKLAIQIKDVMASIEAMLIIGLGLIWFVSPSVAGGGQVAARLAEADFTVVNSGYEQGLGARLTSPGDLIRTLRIPEENGRKGGEKYERGTGERQEIV